MSLFPRSALPEWRNWQTQRTQNPPTRVMWVRVPPWAPILGVWRNGRRACFRCKWMVSVRVRIPPPPPSHGELAEWMNAHEWRSCGRLKASPGFESLTPRQNLSWRPSRASLSYFGELAEWSIAVASKATERESVPWVRIPDFPPIVYYTIVCGESEITWKERERHLAFITSVRTLIVRWVSKT